MIYIPKFTIRRELAGTAYGLGAFGWFIIRYNNI